MQIYLSHNRAAGWNSHDSCLESFRGFFHIIKEVKHQGDLFISDICDDDLFFLLIHLFDDSKCFFSFTFHDDFPSMVLNFFRRTVLLREREFAYSLFFSTKEEDVTLMAIHFRSFWQWSFKKKRLLCFLMHQMTRARVLMIAVRSKRLKIKKVLFCVGLKTLLNKMCVRVEIEQSTYEWLS